MQFCTNCGEELIKDAKFCHKCGYSIKHENDDYTKRKQEYAGKLCKCPNCGEVLKSFELNCPVCGYELRGVRASSAVKEFALKLEAIEAKREYEKPGGLFAIAATLQKLQYVSKTDEQKISLIKSFSVPNSKEDMLEFMILATSSMNMNTYDPMNTNISKSEKEINAAWFSKVQQVYEKAKRIYSADDIFEEIKVLYDNCNVEIRKAKRKGIIKGVLLIGWSPLFLIFLIIFLTISEPRDEDKEIKRLENIVIEIQEALDNKEYKHALRIADSIDYQRYDIEMERKWDIEREYWIEKVIEEARVNALELDYIPSDDIDNANDEPVEKTSEREFSNGFTDGIQSGLDAAKENIDEFNRVMNSEESTTGENME